MTQATPNPSLHLTSNGLLLCLFALLFLFYPGPNPLYGGISFALLAAYHLLFDRRFRGRKGAVRWHLPLHLLAYLILCTLLIWATTAPDEESPYWLIYVLPIAVAAEHLNLARTLTTCAAASLLYISLIPFPLFFDPEQGQEDIPEILVFCTMFFIVGILIQSFSERSRRQLQTERELNDRLLENQRVLGESLARLEAAEEDLRRQDRLAALGEMAAGIAHEIRNPLGIISSSAQLLEKSLPGSGERSRQLIGILQEETQRLDALITDFLTFGRPPRPQRRQTDLSALLRRSLEHLKGLASSRQLGLRLDLPPDPALAEVDTEMLQRALLNLLLNALEATGPGGEVRVSLRRGETSLTVEIADNGCGISEENLSRIFNPFFTTKERGTGLGLANAYKIVEAHGGELTVESRPGEGSTFTLRLPQEA